MEQNRNRNATAGKQEPYPGGGEGGLLNRIGVGMVKFLLDGDLTLLWANPPFYDCAGYPEEEFRARFPGLRQLCTACPEEFQTVKNAWLRAMETGEESVRVSLRMPRRDGGFRWMRFDGTIAEEAADGCRAVWAAATDIHELICGQEEAARLCAEKNSYFHWMMDEYVGNVYISDMETYDLLYVNQESCNVLGKSSEEVVGQKCYEVIQGRNSPCPFCTNDRLTADSFYEWEFDNPVLKRTFMIKNRIVNWEGRRARIELSHDMYSAEFKLAKKDREREAIIRTIPGGLARVDAGDMRTVLWYGGGFLQMIGYTEEQFETELHSQCNYVHPDDLARTVEVMEQSRTTGDGTIVEARVVTRDGEVKILTITFSYIRGEDSWDGIPSFYSVGIDVTKERMEQARQRKALEEAYQTARVANAAKTNFLSSMSHDIRTPMNAIMGMTAIARANLSSPERLRDCLNKINVSSRHLLSLINEVLDMSRIESGKIDLAPENVDLSELIESVSDMVNPLIAEKNQKFQILVGQVRHEKVITDGDRLRQVFMNLLSNAVKYTPENGKISLTINELPSMIPGRGRFEFIFTDNGIGMSEDFIPRIFEPFSRAEDSRISKVQGTGLGMAITENIVHMMNGSIEVKSELGTGSQFIVSIPLELQKEDEAREELLAGLPVLVADDDVDVCQNAALLLEELGMRSFWVLSGEEAVSRVQAAHEQQDDFFAVILDWKMPGMDGLETLKTIRRLLGGEVPIIIVSAYDYSSIEEEFLEAGADAFISKPLFKSKMLRVLQLFCTGNRLEKSNSAFNAERYRLVQGKRVLLAEDNELNREIALEFLHMGNIEADCAVNGREALERFLSSEPGTYDLILMDLQMPVMDGLTATVKIRESSHPQAGSIPILALTANAFEEDISRCLAAGMNGHMAKPLDIHALFQKMADFI